MGEGFRSGMVMELSFPLDFHTLIPQRHIGPSGAFAGERKDDKHHFLRGGVSEKGNQQENGIRFFPFASTPLPHRLRPYFTFKTCKWRNVDES